MAGAAGRGRTSGIVYGALSTALLLLLVTSLLNAPTPSLPAIAEIAPQAVARIKEAPPQQATKNGDPSVVGTGKGDPGGKGGGGHGGLRRPGIGKIPPTPGPGEGPGKPSKFLCVAVPTGYAPRQIEDPQSPPCVLEGPEDSPSTNGGSTTSGVSSTDIRIGVPTGYAPYFNAIITFVNDRFNLHGRKLVAIPVNMTGKGDGSCAAGEQDADAADAKQKQVFAVMDYFQCYGIEYNRAVAREGIIATPSTSSSYTEKDLQAFAPFIWQYGMAADNTFAHLGAFICTKLKGGKADRAGTRDGTDMTTEARKFGLYVAPDNNYYTLDATPLRQQLSGCGIHIDSNDDRYIPGGSGSATDTPTVGGSTAGEDAVSAWKADKVTSVICLAITLGCDGLDDTMSQQDYMPELIASTYGENDDPVFNNFDQASDRGARIFGITDQPREDYIPNTPSMWAFFAGGGVLGAGSSTSNTVHLINSYYRSLLIIASGVQMAGPRLTPQTFERGLQTTRFPNPATPLQAGDVGFAGTHSMTVDATPFYYDPSTSGPYPDDPPGAPGAACYPENNGQRFTISEWVKGPFPSLAQTKNGNGCLKGTPGLG